MDVSLRRRAANITPYRASLWFVVVLVVVSAVLQGEPWRQQAKPVTHEGLSITRESASDVLIVLDYEAIQQSPAAFSDKDWSAAWINMMEQEVGPVSIASPRSLSQRVLDESRVVILTASVTRQRLPEGLRGQLVEHVKRGNVLVLERPTGELRELFSADGRANERRGERVTFVRGLAEPFHEQLRQLPLSTDYVGSTGVREGAVPLMAIDGALVVYALTVSKGVAITVDFDLGEQLVSLQQGRPKTGFVVKPTDPSRAHPTTADLVASERMVGHAVPMADLLERFMVHGVIGRYHPLPVFWPYPGGARGVVVGVHEDRRLGDGGGWMLDHERRTRQPDGSARHSASSSLLLTTDAGLTAAGGATIQRMGGDVGLLWRMAGTPAAAWEPMGVGSFRPVARPTSLKAQLDHVRGKLPAPSVRTVRTVDGWWSSRWAAPFEEMAAEGVRVDMSYATPRISGYAYGTGFPFMALSAQGMPLGVRELPIVVPEHAIEGPSLKELLERSQKGHHMAIGLSIAPSSFADYPDMERFHQWLEMFSTIEQTDHRMLSAQRFEGFLRRRRASSLRSRLVRDIPMALPGADQPRLKLPTAAASEDRDKKKDEKPEDLPRGTLLRVTVEAKAAGMWLCVPERVGDRLFAIARQHPNRVGGEVVSAELHTDRVDLVGFELRRIKLERGFNTIDIFYR